MMQTFWLRLRVQGRILHALMLREILTRFGRHNLGFFWLIGEPLILTLGVMAVWSVTRGHLEGDVGIVPFVLTGYTLVTLFRHIIGRSVHCMRHNAGLMFHRNVTYIDTLIVRALLEIGGTGLSFLIAYVPLYLFGFAPDISDPLVLVGGWLFMGWVSFGIGLILAGLSEMSEIVERFVQPLMYLSLPLTGLFYMVSWLPENARRVVSYSPLVNATEMTREGLMGSAVEAYWNFSYLLNSCFLLTGVGLVIVRRARRYARME
jgi:capsular polysaccharide transport system permease protein